MGQGLLAPTPLSLSRPLPLIPCPLALQTTPPSPPHPYQSLPFPFPPFPLSPLTFCKTYTPSLSFLPSPSPAPPPHLSSVAIAYGRSPYHECKVCTPLLLQVRRQLTAVDPYHITQDIAPLPSIPYPLPPPPPFTSSLPNLTLRRTGPLSSVPGVRSSPSQGTEAACWS